MPSAPGEPQEPRPKRTAGKKLIERRLKREARLMEDTLADKPEGKPKAEKDAVIKEAWINQAQGFGSKMSLIRDAKALDPSIKNKDVDTWWNENRDRKNKMKGCNSFGEPQTPSLHLTLGTSSKSICSVLLQLQATAEHRSAQEVQKESLRHLRRGSLHQVHMGCSCQ